MKHILLMVLLALPMTAFADEVDFDNRGGTLTGTSDTLSLSGSQLTQVTGFNGMGLVQGADLGSISFTTGTLKSGNMMNGAIFNPGGTFVITGNTKDGMPAVIFSGSFTGTTKWISDGSLGLCGSAHYTLTGSISGTWYNGSKVSGATAQMIVGGGKNGLMDSVSLGGGFTGFTVTPEPGTLGLLGIGLVGMAGILRRKRKS